MEFQKEVSEISFHLPPFFLPKLKYISYFWENFSYSAKLAKNAKFQFISKIQNIVTETIF